MLVLLALAAAALAQDIGSLSPCAVTCVSTAATQANCALATPQCLCPHQQDIAACIGQSCPTSDLESSLHAIQSFCQTTSSTTPAQTTSTTLSTSSRSVAMSTTRTTSTTPQSTQQSTTTTTTSSSASPSSTSTTPSVPAATTTTTSTSAPPNTPTPPPPTPSTPSQPQTVVVLSTQFPSTQPFTGNTGAAPGNFVSIPHLVIPLLLTALCLI